jgi:putative ABC transport system permease protein
MLGLSSLAGDRSPLAFPLLFSLRSHSGRHRTPFLLTVLAIATSVALATGLEMATRGIQTELLRTADSLAGASQLEISAGGVGLPEQILERVESIEGVLVAAPMLLATFRVPLPDGTRLGLRVLGVDLLADREIRGYSLEESDVEVSDRLRLVSQPDSLIVTRELADRLGLSLGERFEVIAPSGPLATVVRGILEPGGVADAYGSQIAAMDIYALQQHLGRTELFDRIDIVPEPGTDLDALRARLEAAVQGIASVRRPDSRNEFADQVFGTVSTGIWAIACIGVLVASLLSYGTISLSVDARLREFALLQAAGLEARRVRRMVRIDVLLLTGIGTALGLAAGWLLGSAFFQPLTRLLAENDGAQIHVRGLEPTAWTLLVALGVGSIVGLAASVEPAWRATDRRPLDVLREAGTGAARALPSRPAARRTGLAFAAALLAGALPLPIPAVPRVGLIYLGGIGALIAGTRPLALPLLSRACRHWQDVVPSIGAFLGRSLTARPGQTALTAGMIAGIVSGLAAISVLLSSIERSFGDWVGSRYRGGVMITAGDPYDRAQRDLLSAETIAAIRSTEGVGAVLESINTPVLFRGEEVILFARNMEILAQRGQLSVLGRPWPEVAAELAAGRIAVSDAFERRFGLSPGDRLSLDTARGPRSFEIAAVVRDYYGASGSLHLDLAQFDASWIRNGASSAVVWPELERDRVVAAIRHSVAGRQLLFFVDSDDYSSWVMAPFERFVNLLVTVSAFTASLGGLAVLTLMTGAVSQRSRELAFLRTSGATSGMLSLLVVSDSLIIAGYGILGGLLLGLLCSRPMCAVLTEWLGWTVEWSVSLAPLGWICGIALACALLSALHPAVMVRRTRPISAALAD